MTWSLWIPTAQPGDLKLVDWQVLDYLRVLLVLGAVLLLAYLGVRHLLPKFLGMRQTASGPLQILARLPLEPGKNIYVIRAGSVCFLVGTSAAGMHYLTMLEGDAVESFSAAPKPAGFASLMKNVPASKE